MTDATNDFASGAWLRPKKPVRLALAALLSAPIAGAILALVLGLTVLTDLVFMMEDPTRDSEFIRADAGGIAANILFLMSAGFIFGGIIGWPATLAVALPAHAFLLRKTSAKIFWYAALGLGAGLAATTAYLAGVGGGGAGLSAVNLLVYGGSAGIVAGCIFWLIRRPDAGK